LIAFKEVLSPKVEDTSGLPDLQMFMAFEELLSPKVSLMSELPTSQI
jgi:hypothetical protein